MAVDGSLFDGSLELTEGHSNDIGAQSTEGLLIDLIPLDPDCQPFQVLGSTSWSLLIRQTAHTRFAPGKPNHSTQLGKLGKKLLPN